MPREVAAAAGRSGSSAAEVVAADLAGPSEAEDSAYYGLELTGAADADANSSAVSAAARASAAAAMATDVVNRFAAFGPMRLIAARVMEAAGAKARKTVEALTPDQYPMATQPSGEWEVVKAGHWMSGLFSGVLWQLYEHSGRKEQFWADKAQEWQAGLAGRQRESGSQHDFGFIYLPSFAHSYSVTGSPEDKRQALAAAEALSWAFVPGSKSLRSFDGWKTPSSTDAYQQIVIIDFMMNIQMLVWGARHVTSPALDLRMDPRPAETWLQMAKDHARQVAANHVRPDGTTYHIVEYNPNTGSVNKKYTYQGYSDSSTWARGQAWAICGFAMLHNATGDHDFLETARKLTDKYLELLSAQPAKAARAARAAEGRARAAMGL